MKDAMTDHKAEWVLFLRKLSASVREGMNLPDAYSQPVADDYCNDLANEIDAEIDRIAAAPAASEGENGAVAWQYRRQPEEPWEPVDRYSVRALVGDGDEYRPLYTRPAAQVAATRKHDEGRIAEAVNRFLCWRLPDDFAPDAGISYTPTPRQPGWLHDLHPTGTNLFNAAQAKAMFEHCLATQPAARRVTEAEQLLTNLVDDVFSLISESEGVYGLHLNGDPSPWEELLPGSRFERFSTLNDALALVESFAQPAEGVSGG